eukprot:TRINITY_DN4651_c0_g4_i1.p1 TRINITY_DN4651_c0_g4~~TRINITY_DN4651_c0_g4_i1.p1  ORF type:complete len:287 (+),score=49.49 TRINITY_DN4651_c0_g4_i1:294-1154(+)
MSELQMAAAVGLLSSVVSGGATMACLRRRRVVKSVEVVEEATGDWKIVSFEAKGHEKKNFRFRENQDSETMAEMRKAYGTTDQQMMVAKRENKAVKIAHKWLKHGETLTLEIDSRDWVEISNELRKEGNTCFSLGNQTGRKAEHIEALRLYQEAHVIIPVDGGEQAVSMFCLAMSNCAQVCIKLKSFKFAKDICTEVLALDPNSMKTLYRRGLATRKNAPKCLDDLRAALIDLEQAVSIAVSTQNTLVTEIRRECEEVRQAITTLTPAEKVPEHPIELSARNTDLD